MAEIKKSGGEQIVDYMARDYDSFLESMQAMIPAKLPEWKDYKSQADFGHVLLQLFAHMGDVLSYYQDRIANESFLSTARTRASVIEHLKLIGCRLSTAVPAATVLTVTLPAAAADPVEITKGDAFATQSTKSRPPVRFEYTGDEPMVLDPAETRTFFVPVEQGRLIREESLGTSDGRPNQRFSLAHAGLILRAPGKSRLAARDIVLTVTHGAVIEAWTLQETLAFSSGDAKDFIIEIDENDLATIIFGDNAFGAIPPTGATITATYRTGGGLEGNVPAGAVTMIVDASALSLAGAKVVNNSPATGGSDRESIDHAVSLAPQVFRSMKRAVTAEDFKALALDFNGVGKVRAQVGNWNRVLLFTAPEGGGRVSDVLRANLIAYFEDKRPMSTVVEIHDVDYVKIYISATVGISSYYSAETMEKRITAAAAGLLAFDSVDFGQTLYISKFYEALEAIEGVAYVTITEFRTEAEAADTLPDDGKISLRISEIPKIPDKPENPDAPGDDTHYGQGLRVTLDIGTT